MHFIYAKSFFICWLIFFVFSFIFVFFKDIRNKVWRQKHINIDAYSIISLPSSFIEFGHFFVLLFILFFCRFIGTWFAACLFSAQKEIGIVGVINERFKNWHLLSNVLTRFHRRKIKNKRISFKLFTDNYIKDCGQCRNWQSYNAFATQLN